MGGPKEEFKELVYDSIRVQGADERVSRIMSVLFSEPEPLTLQELSEKTHYSFSAVSAAMKILNKANSVKRIKKPGFKKIFFTIERDFAKLICESLTIKFQQVTSPAIQKLPNIIKMCKEEKSEDSQETLILMEKYYQEMIVTEKILNEMIKLIEKFQTEGLK